MPVPHAIWTVHRLLLLNPNQLPGVVAAALGFGEKFVLCRSGKNARSFFYCAMAFNLSWKR
jgi:hypothetical protein